MGPGSIESNHRCGLPDETAREWPAKLQGMQSTLTVTGKSAISNLEAVPPPVFAIAGCRCVQ